MNIILGNLIFVYTVVYILYIYTVYTVLYISKNLRTVPCVLCDRITRQDSELCILRTLQEIHISGSLLDISLYFFIYFI